MMMLALFGAAGLAVMPVPLQGDGRADYGSYSRFDSVTEPTWVRVDAVVDPTGTPVRCDVVGSSGVTSRGSRKLEKFACERLTRDRFRAARDEDGQPVAAVVRRAFALNMTVPADASPDFAIPVSRLPASATTPFVTVRLVTDVGGAVTSCAVAASSGNPEVDRLACPGVAAAALPPARDASGSPLRAVRQVGIAFTTPAN